ncbi:hypothetical protein FKR81_09405 [Lentzea tibetensis]|uniref:Uncharacterized protein n=1 Tax=Lentzea tibetensis TaxID=2591470 RepID=A0A563EXY5_9PSEU|nr:hypothetical protein [Lentzea tibetensis]TWP52529.1 hypothetical protein FKR81_09405 [Lentzea tibetensis]
MSFLQRVISWTGAATMALGLVVLTPVGAAQAAPPTPDFGPSIDAYAQYDGQKNCEGSAKPGPIGVRDLLNATYGNHTSGISRNCNGTVSEHHEGRALDYHFNYFDGNDRAKAEDFLGWLLATDQYGNGHAMARRLGVMYVIWNNRIWEAYRPGSGWQPYSGDSPHQDHVHISFSWPGALKQTSWWSGGNVSVEGTPAAVSMRDGHQEVFTRGGDGQVWHKWWYGTTWSDWAPMGGGAVSSAPAAVSMHDNHIELFARGPGGDVLHRFYYGNGWSDWYSLGGNIVGTPSVVSMRPGHLEVFARGTDNQIWHKWWYGSTWSEWAPMGGGSVTSSPSVASMTDGHLELFVRGPGGDLLHRFYYGNGWSPYHSLGGSIQGSPSAVSMYNGHLEVFARGNDNAIWHNFWYGNGWSGWGSLGGSLKDSPSVLTMRPNQLELFARGTDNVMYHKYYYDGGQWSPWYGMGSV